MSAIEETLARIASLSGVVGYIIVDAKGIILRQSKSLSPSEAALYARDIQRLTQKARHVVRDLDPKNDLEIFRMRSKEHEIMAAPGPGGAFLLIVIQKWTPTSSEEYAAAAALLAPGAASAAGAAAAAGTGSK